LTQASLYNKLTLLLTLKQFKTLMGGDSSYKSKAERAKLVCKSKRVHELANRIIELDAKRMNCYVVGIDSLGEENKMYFKASNESEAMRIAFSWCESNGLKFGSMANPVEF
jgi:hypothetical protein